MKRNLEIMSLKDYDVFIIGGGINGAVIAHDAVLRGLKVALVEKNDFGSGTTSKSSKLAHGGLRYLRNYEFDLVRESLSERRILQKIAPHLVYPMPFLMPLYENGRNNKYLVKLGIILYDLLAYDKSWMEYDEQKIPWHRLLTPREVANQEPRILTKGLECGIKYYDCQISSPERLCLEFILTAAKNGANVSNYTELEKLVIKDNKVKGAIVKDRINDKEYKINAKVVVNASGPWLDKVIGTYKQDHKPLLRGTKGIHIITPKVSNNTVVLTSKKTGRDFFIEPWKNHSLIGTTDVDYKGNIDDVHATKEDILDLIEEVNEVYRANISLNDVKHSYAGVRPLVCQEGKKETEISRKYLIREGDIEGLITIMGGKITTARNLAENVVDNIAIKLGKSNPCLTKVTPLYGSTKGHARYTKKQLEKHVDKDLITYLINTYGSKYEKVLKYKNQDAGQRITHDLPDIKAQVLYALEEEMAQTLEDFMLRRTSMGSLGYPGNTCTFTVAEIMADYLGWGKAKKLEEIEKFQKKVEVKKW